jgi:transposase
MGKEALLSDAQWEKIARHLPNPPRHRGRPWRGNREVLEGILWVLRTGARWRDLPEKYPSPSTCWRRLRKWEDEDLWLKIWRIFLGELDAKQKLDWSEAFVDASFASAKKGTTVSGQPAGAKERSGWWWSTAKVFLWEVDWSRPRRRK